MTILSTSQNTTRLFAIAMGVYTLVAIITFGSLSQHHFELDDFAYLKDLNQIQQDPSTLLSQDRRLPGRPVTDLALLAIQSTFTNNPTAFHIALVLCHLITTCLLTFTFYKTGINPELSLIGGLFFLVNLAHFRAIHWISCLAYPLALGLGCIGILAYIFYQEKTHIKWYIVSLCAFLLALLAHPAAIACPLFIAYIAYQKKQPLRPVGIIGTIAFLFLIGILKLFPQVPQAEHATAVLQWHITDLIQHAFWYLGRLWVSTFVIFRDLSTIQTADLLLGITALIGVGLLLFYRTFPIALWGVWMLLSLAVFITNPNQTHFESGPSRHLYFASAGSALLLAWLCQQLSTKITALIQTPWISKVCLACLIVIITGLSIVGLKKAEVFTYAISARAYLVSDQREQATHLFEKAIAQSPNLVSSSMYEMFLIANLMDGKFLTHSLHQALAHYPQNKILVALRMLYGFQSNTVDPQHLTDRIVIFAKKHDPNTQKFVAISCLNLGYHFATHSQNASAKILLKGALVLKPDYPEAALHLSQLYIQEKKIKAARQVLHIAIDYNPTHIEALQKLVDIYHLEKNWPQVENLYKRLYALNPESTDLMFKLGYTYMRQQKYAEALPLFSALTQKVPNNWQNFAYYGQCLHAQGHLTDAISAYQQALQLNPNQPELKILLQQIASQK